MKVAYEKHPVSKERKAELRAMGFRIVDARFAPHQPIADVVDLVKADDQEPEAPKPKRTYKRKKGVSE